VKNVFYRVSGTLGKECEFGSDSSKCSSNSFLKKNLLKGSLFVELFLEASPKNQQTNRSRETEKELLLTHLLNFSLRRVHITEEAA
jgi:hypothetical protein